MTGAIKRFFTKEPMAPHKVMLLLILTLLVLIIFEDIRKPSSLMFATYLAVSLVNMSIAILAIIRMCCIESMNK